MLTRPLELPVTVAVDEAVGGVHRRVIPIVLAYGRPDERVIHAATTLLRGSFGPLDVAVHADVAPLAGAPAGTLAVTLDTPREIRRVRLADRPDHSVSLHRLDASALVSDPSVVAANGTTLADPPADFMDRRFAIRARNPAGEFDATLDPAALAELVVRSRPARPRFGLAVAGSDDDGAELWSAASAERVEFDAGAELAAAVSDGLGELGDRDPATLGFRLVVSSDAPCELALTALEVGWRFAGAPLATGAAKTVLDIAAGPVARVAVDIELPAWADVHEATLETFERLPEAAAPSRDWSELTGDLAGATTGMRVEPGRPVAALTSASQGRRLERVALGLLALEQPAEVAIELFADRDGAPEHPALASADTRLDHAGARAWTALALTTVAPVPAAIWIRLTALRGALVWLALGAGTTVLRRGDAPAAAGPPLCVELLGEPVPADPVPRAAPLSLEVGGVPVAVPPDDHGTRVVDIKDALGECLLAARSRPANHDPLAPARVPITLRAAGPGSITVYRPRIVYDVFER